MLIGWKFSLKLQEDWCEVRTQIQPIEKNSDEMKSVWFHCITVSGNAKKLSTVIWLKPTGVKNSVVCHKLQY